MDIEETMAIVEAVKEQNSKKNQAPLPVDVLEDEFGEKYEVVRVGEVTLPNGEYVEMIGDNNRWVLKDDDVVVVSYPKTGTHWINNLLNSLYIKGPLDVVPSFQHCNLEFLLQRHFDSLPSPYIHASHMKPNLLPPNTFQEGRKLILVVRNPKDTAVSLYHHLRKDRMGGPEPKITWSCYLDNWIKDAIFFFNYFEFYREWQCCIENNKDVDILVVHYEQLKTDALNQLRRIQNYLGFNHSDDRLRDILTRCSVESMKNKVENKKMFTMLTDEQGQSIIFRKGVVGDWKNYFTVAQNEQIDALVAKTFQKTTVYNYKSMTGY